MRVLFLDTHVSPTDHIVLAGHRGCLFREQGLADPFSGLQDFSFWPTAEALDEMLAQAGFTVVRRRLWPIGRTALASTCCAKRHVRRSRQ